MDIADSPARCERALARQAPWAVVNARPYARVDEAETDVPTAAVFRENALGPEALASLCGRHHLPLVTFSTDLVFDGRQDLSPLRRERPGGAPALNVYGRSKAEGELRSAPTATPNRWWSARARSSGPGTSTTSSPCCCARCSAASRSARRAISRCPRHTFPTSCTPCLDLLIDCESGIWHLTNGDAMTWYDWACAAAEAIGLRA